MNVRTNKYQREWHKATKPLLFSGQHQKVASYSFYGELKGERDYYGGIKANLLDVEVK
jgi:hypothetical protein